MTKKTKTAGKTAKSAIQNYSYANVYAIQTCPLAVDEVGSEVTKFISGKPYGDETLWADDAMMFDTPEEALAKLITLKLPREKADDGVIYPRVVRVELKCDIKSANYELHESLLK